MDKTIPTKPLTNYQNIKIINTMMGFFQLYYLNYIQESFRPNFKLTFFNYLETSIYTKLDGNKFILGQFFVKFNKNYELAKQNNPTKNITLFNNDIRFLSAQELFSIIIFSIIKLLTPTFETKYSLYEYLNSFTIDSNNIISLGLFPQTIKNLAKNIYKINYFPLEPFAHLFDFILPIFNMTIRETLSDKNIIKTSKDEPFFTFSNNTYNFKLTSFGSLTSSGSSTTKRNVLLYNPFNNLFNILAVPKYDTYVYNDFNGVSGLLKNYTNNANVYGILDASYDSLSDLLSSGLNIKKNNFRSLNVRFNDDIPKQNIKYVSNTNSTNLTNSTNSTNLTNLVYSNNNIMSLNDSKLIEINSNIDFILFLLNQNPKNDIAYRGLYKLQAGKGLEPTINCSLFNKDYTKITQPLEIIIYNTLIIYSLIDTL
jgi:hypothetical protein